MQRFSRRDYRKLGKPIQRIRLRTLEKISGIKVSDFGALTESETASIEGFNLRNRGFARGQTFPGLCGVLSQSTNNSQTGNGNPSQLVSVARGQDEPLDPFHNLPHGFNGTSLLVWDVDIKLPLKLKQHVNLIE